MTYTEVKIGSFNEMNDEELNDVNGGSTKVAMGICYAGAGICAARAAYEDERGNRDAAAAWAGAGVAFTTVGTVLSFFPAP